MNYLWGPADTRYLVSSGVCLLAIILSVGAIMLMLFHCSVKEKAAQYYVSAAANQISRAASALLNKQESYVKNHFYDVARASEMYNNSISQYFKDLIEKADKQERSIDSIKKFSIWLTEFFLVFFGLIGLMICLTLYL